MIIGASLFAVFPGVYAVFLPAFYLPVLLLLFGLIFRGVAFEHRHSGRARGLWDWGFALGSGVVGFVQGAAVGAMIRGIHVMDGQYAGGWFEWPAPLPMLCGSGLMLGCALLGAGWLVLKTEGALQDWGWRRIRLLAAGVIVILGVAFVAAFAERTRTVGELGSRPWGAGVFVLPMIAIYTGVVHWLFRGKARKGYGRPPDSAGQHPMAIRE